MRCGRERRGAEDVDHLLEVAQLALQVLDVLPEARPLALRELEAQVEERREGLARGHAFARRVGPEAFVQSLVEPQLISSCFGSIRSSLPYRDRSQRPAQPRRSHSASRIGSGTRAGPPDEACCSGRRARVRSSSP